jgi:hypothetical protein
VLSKDKYLPSQFHGQTFNCAGGVLFVIHGSSRTGPRRARCLGSESNPIGSRWLSATPSSQSTMDSAFMPTEIAVKHFVYHKFTFDFGPSVISLGKPIRNIFIGVVAIYCVTDIVKSVLQSVLKKGSTGSKE